MAPPIRQPWCSGVLHTYLPIYARPCLCVGYLGS
jgi:hypothetical protein